ncbi:Alpha/beta hydrolase-like protein [Rhodococcus sp. RD6.2]|uniref:alpha/beta fold hydrolase n=1 Tax=Rhodococcus sp. RD6.2 TaxID=260936 RepID=UPI00063B8179|nr:alpha/beta hydrolase [Rhodococcus sp. RD6.2]CRK52408.1 Alpha/beta hydrolase-like protein [Rhodococcus sp. RD6.2]
MSFPKQSPFSKKPPFSTSLRPRAARWSVAAVVALTPLALSVAPVAAAPLPTVVLVHGAFADSTGWNDVAANLTARGYPVETFDNPLRGPAYDSTLLEQKLAGIEGPIVLVGHSYGGVVISNTDDPDVKANVYIAAFAPDRGEFVQGILNPLRFPGSKLLPPALQLKIVDDAQAIGGKNLDGYIAGEYFHGIFAQDVDDATAADMFAHQQSAALWANLEPSATPTWTTRPNWYLVSTQDQVIPPDAQRFMADRARAHTTEIDASHASLVSRPDEVTAVIVDAAGA